eukprot:scaffold16082_cov110-Isochrysis_galbana.AAC.3
MRAASSFCSKTATSADIADLSTTRLVSNSRIASSASASAASRCSTAILSPSTAAPAWPSLCRLSRAAASDGSSAAATVWCKELAAASSLLRASASLLSPAALSPRARADSSRGRSENSSAGRSENSCSDWPEGGSAGKKSRCSVRLSIAAAGVEQSRVG